MMGLAALDVTFGARYEHLKAGGWAQEDLMSYMTRRNVVLSAGAAAAAFGLDRTIEIIGPASAEQGGGPTQLNPRGVKFTASRSATSRSRRYSTAPVERDHNPAFAKNASIEDIKAALKAAGLPTRKCRTPTPSRWSSSVTAMSCSIPATA